ncbi:hypothetical protein EJB05_27783, partial [Eragrostis curvula]
MCSGPRLRLTSPTKSRPPDAVDDSPPLCPGLAPALGGPGRGAPPRPGPTAGDAVAGPRSWLLSCQYPAPTLLPRRRPPPRRSSPPSARSEDIRQAVLGFHSKSQVTRFRCGGFSVGMHMCHPMHNGSGIPQFLEAIGDMARGEPQPTVLPVWERELLTSRSVPRVTHAHLAYMSHSTTTETQPTT